MLCFRTLLVNIYFQQKRQASTLYLLEPRSAPVCMFYFVTNSTMHAPRQIRIVHQVIQAIQPQKRTMFLFSLNISLFACSIRLSMRIKCGTNHKVGLPSSRQLNSAIQVPQGGMTSMMLNVGGRSNKPLGLQNSWTA